MAEISIGSAVGAGFGVIRRRPVTVLIWGLLQTALFAATVLLMAPTYFAMIAEFSRTAASGNASPPDLSNLMQTQAVGMLLNLIATFVGAILSCAVFREVIHPERSRFAYLRVGTAELMLFVLVFGGSIALAIGSVIAMIPAAIVVGVLVALHAFVAAGIVGVLLGLVALAALAFVALRLSMIGPMMVDDGKLHFSDAWALTRGKAGALFLVALCLFAVLFGLEILLIGIAAFIGLSLIGGPSALTALSVQSAPAVLSHLAPLFMVGAVAAIPLYGALLAIICAPWSRAYLDLRADPAAVF